MSEACGSISRTEIGDPVEAHATTVGRPLPWLETRLVDGELWIRGEPITRAYHGEARPAVDGEGWLATGDLFELDVDGRLRFKGRLKDVLTVGGFNVSPAEVERALAAHPDVRRAVVVDAPDQRLGQVPVAFVVLEPGRTPTEADLAAHCSERLSGYKVPRRFIPLPELPMSSAGKIQRYRLRQLIPVDGKPL
jgi:HIP---CoA ligase